MFKCHLQFFDSRFANKKVVTNCVHCRTSITRVEKKNKIKKILILKKSRHQDLLYV